jgi:hypothetical protein
METDQTTIPTEEESSVSSSPPIEYHAGNKSVMLTKDGDVRFIAYTTCPHAFSLAKQYLLDGRFNDLNFFIEYGHRKKIGEFEIESTPGLWFNIYYKGEISFATTHREYDDIMSLVFYSEYPDLWVAFHDFTENKVNAEEDLKIIKKNIEDFEVNVFKILKAINSQNVWAEGSFLVYEDGTMEIVSEEVLFKIQGQRALYQIDPKKNTCHVLGEEEEKVYLCLGVRGELVEIKGLNNKETNIAHKIVFLLNDDMSKDEVLERQINRAKYGWEYDGC